MHHLSCHSFYHSKLVLSIRNQTMYFIIVWIANAVGVQPDLVNVVANMVLCLALSIFCLKFRPAFSSHQGKICQKFILTLTRPLHCLVNHRMVMESLRHSLPDLVLLPCQTGWTIQTSVFPNFQFSLSLLCTLLSIHVRLPFLENGLFSDSHVFNNQNDLLCFFVKKEIKRKTYSSWLFRLLLLLPLSKHWPDFQL